jgi:hypothetical protein
LQKKVEYSSQPQQYLASIINLKEKENNKNLTESVLLKKELRLFFNFFNFFNFLIFF